eukprot:scaffold3777_cov335-Prasinococcus_capsulatus_cf.AAC.4
MDRLRMDDTVGCAPIPLHSGGRRCYGVTAAQSRNHSQPPTAPTTPEPMKKPAGPLHSRAQRAVLWGHPGEGVVGGTRGEQLADAHVGDKQQRVELEGVHQPRGTRDRGQAQRGRHQDSLGSERVDEELAAVSGGDGQRLLDEIHDADGRRGLGVVLAQVVAAQKRRRVGHRHEEGRAEDLHVNTTPRSDPHPAQRPAHGSRTYQAEGRVVAIGGRCRPLGAEHLDSGALLMLQLVARLLPLLLQLPAPLVALAAAEDPEGQRQHEAVGDRVAHQRGLVVVADVRRGLRIDGGVVCQQPGRSAPANQRPQQGPRRHQRVQRGQPRGVGVLLVFPLGGEHRARQRQ